MDTGGQSKPDNMIRLAEKMALTERFNTLFRDGMALVEESASYLDGPGRAAARDLPKGSTGLYGAELMRLTTRLMQLASWLLLQRAANEGEMSRSQFLEEKKKIRLDTLPSSDVSPEWEYLPGDFVALVNRSLTLQNRIKAIDAEIYSMKPFEVTPENPVRQQLDLLSTALGISRKPN